MTYGAMSLQPVAIPAPLLIFRDIRVRGFWLSGRWAQQQGLAGRAAAIDRIVGLIRGGSLAPPQMERFLLSDWRGALAALQQPHKRRKVMFVGGCDSNAHLTS